MNDENTNNPTTEDAMGKHRSQEEEELEHKIKAALFGTLKSFRPAPGGFQPPPEKLTAPLEGPRSIAHLFCEGCGFSYEITEGWLQLAEEFHGVAKPVTLQNFYVHVKRCRFCNEIYQGIEYRPLDSVS